MTDNQEVMPVIVGPSGRVRSGQARMQKLSPEERRELGRKAAAMRWRDVGGNKLPVEKTDHIGEFTIANRSIPCAVLPDGTRLISERALVKSFGGKRGGAHWRRKSADGSGANLPIILSANNLRPFIDNELLEALNDRRLYTGPGMRSPAHGLRAELYPKICEVYLKARDASALQHKQKPFAIAAEILMRGLAHTGITALVDEATGYQYVRDQRALQEILNAYIGKELAKWAKRFPDEFYREIFRLRSWHYDPKSSRRPMLMAQITVDLVFDRIGPGLTKELRERRQEIFEASGKKGKLHQVLSTDVGHPALQHHLSGLTFMGKAFKDGDWNNFYKAVDVAAPRYNRTLTLPFPEQSIPPDANEPQQPSEQ
jgi:P63C domain-containing protein